MIQMLDTGTMLTLLTTPAPALRAKLSDLDTRPVLSAISVAELLAIAQRPGNEALQTATTQALPLFDVLPFGLAEASAYANLAATPAARSSGLRTQHLQVLGHAAAIGAQLITTSTAMRALAPTSSADWTAGAAQ